MGDAVYEGSVIYTTRAGALATARLCERVGLRRCLLAISNDDTDLVYDCAAQGVTVRAFVRRLRATVARASAVAIRTESGGYPWICRVDPWSRR